MSRRICYHGTSREAAREILQDGFLPGTWFARHLEDALGFGGLHVFEVEFHSPPSVWQFMAGPIEPSRIVSCRVYSIQKLGENPSLRQAIFESASEEGE